MIYLFVITSCFLFYIKYERGCKLNNKHHQLRVIFKTNTFSWRIKIVENVDLVWMPLQHSLDKTPLSWQENFPGCDLDTVFTKKEFKIKLMNKFVVASKFFLSVGHYTCTKRNELINLRMGTVICCSLFFFLVHILYFICSLAVEFSFQKIELMNWSYIKIDCK